MGEADLFRLRIHLVHGEVVHIAEPEGIFFREPQLLPQLQADLPGVVVGPLLPVRDEEDCVFGTDKPDLRNPLRILDVTDFFQECTFKPFLGRTVRAITSPGERSARASSSRKQGAIWKYLSMPATISSCLYCWGAWGRA